MRAWLLEACGTRAAGVLRACGTRAAWLFACAGLAACAALPAELLLVGGSPAETGAAAPGDPPAVTPAELPDGRSADTAAVSFTVVPDQTARASWSAPPRGSER
jgi:hypothetical protein